MPIDNYLTNEYSKSMANRKNYLRNAYFNMFSRCYNSKNPHFSNYGGRGIKIHNAWVGDWREFETWAIDNLGHRPSLQYSLDRIDNDGDYVPGNLRWATATTQMNNRRANSGGRILYNGRLLTQTECARELTVSRQYIHQIKKGQANNKYGLQFIK